MSICQNFRLFVSQDHFFQSFLLALGEHFFKPLTTAVGIINSNHYEI